MEAVNHILILLTTLLLLQGCGKDPIQTQLSISQAVHASANAKSMNMKASQSALVQIPTSTENSGWAHIDGIKLFLTEVSLKDNPQNGGDLIFSSSGYEIDLQGESTSITLPSTKEVRAKTYTRFAFEMKSEYYLKAWAPANGQICYTRKNDIACVNGSIDPTAQADYDYYHYNYLYMSTAHSTYDPTGRGHFESTIPGGLTIHENDKSVKLQIIVDTFRSVTFWNGKGSANIAPFSWANNYGVPVHAFFPPGTPNFGLNYVPFFMSINDPGIAQAEVYGLGTDYASVSKFSEESYDLRGVQYMTLLFGSRGNYLQSLVMGFESSGALNQEVGDFNAVTGSTDGAYEFTNGQYNSATGHNWKDRSIHGFYRVYQDGSFTASLGNGPDCGNGALDPEHPEWGPRTQACLSSEIPLYFVRVK